MRIPATAAIVTLLLSSAAGTAAETSSAPDGSYAERAGEPAGRFVNEALNIALDLDGQPYVVVDLTQQVSDASFAAMRSDPLVLAMLIAEDLGTLLTPSQYAEVVRSATPANVESAGAKLASEIVELDRITLDGVESVRLGFSADVANRKAHYVIATFVHGTMAYQLTVFSNVATAEAVREQADLLAGAVSFPGAAPQPDTPARPVDRYRSEAFAYEFSAREDLWFPWANVEEDYPFADLGALGSKTYGAVVMPFCWEGDAPNELALLDVFFEQFGDEYPAAFIDVEEPITREGLSGRYLTGDDDVEGTAYRYDFWVASTSACAYVLAGWGPARLADTAADIEALWDGFVISGEPRVFDDGGATPREREINAWFLNRLGGHYYEARSYREAFRFLAQASDLAPQDPDYLMNALKALTDVDAYHEAYAWLGERVERFGDNLVVRSWDAWLAYQTDDTDKAVRIYDELFTAGYREDEEFAVYLGLLAERGEWARIDATFDAYVGEDVTDELRLVKANLLSRRGRHEEALAILDAMTEGRPFSAEITYAKIDVYDAMGSAAEILELANRLIENNYQSLESWFYKGYAEFSLNAYMKARESFRTALDYSPANETVRGYLDAINGILGEGDNAGISDEIAAVALPSPIDRRFRRARFDDSREGYGAFFLNRVTGIEYDGSEYVLKTHYQQIKVQDKQGIAQFGTLEFDFDPAFEQLYVNRLVVRDADGDVIGEADRDTFYVTDTITGYEASTEQTAHLPVPSLAPGAVIEAVVTKKIGVEAGEMPLEMHYLSGMRPIGYSALFLRGGDERVRHEQDGVGAPRRVDETLVWALENPVVYRWEPMQPFFDELLPWVYVGTTDEDWQRAGSDYFASIEDKLDAARVEDTARRLVADAEDDLEKIAILSRYVQKELNYEAIEFGRRAYIPKPARETLRDRYGDCKDHSVLLYAMLNAVGVPAELALVNSGAQVIPALPDIDQFDHMIVAVPRGEGRLFIDTTDKDLHLGALPPRQLAGNSALIIGRSAQLVGIPDFGPGDSSLDVVRDIEPLDSGELRIFETGTFAGVQAAELRGQLREIEPGEMLDTIQRWVSERYPDAIVEGAYVENLLDADSDLVVELDYRLPVDEHSARLPGFLEAEYLEVGRVAERRFGFESPAPLRVSALTTIRQAGPAKVALTEGKADSGESRFGRWSHKVEDADEGLVLRLDYAGSGSAFAAEEYADYADFHRRIIGSIEQPLWLE